MKLYPVFLGMELLVFTASMGSVYAADKEVQDLTDARQVLARFAEARENLNSYIVKVEEKIIYTYPGFKGTGIGYRKHEWRFDGQRCKNMMSIGAMMSGLTNCFYTLLRRFD